MQHNVTIENKKENQSQILPPYTKYEASTGRRPSNGTSLDLRLHRRQPVMHIRNLLDLLWRR